MALGTLDDNPVIALLADDKEIGETQNVNENMESQGTVVSDIQTEFSQNKSTKKRKVLIEELS